MLNLLIGPAIELASTWVKGRVEQKKAEGELKVSTVKAKAALAERVAAGEIEWEKSMADATDNSWKDEFALVALMLPAMGAFIWPEEVQAGFDVLQTLPDFYQYLLFIAISASFGIKGVSQASKMLGKK